jgi:hypothetical protein
MRNSEKLLGGLLGGVNPNALTADSGDVLTTDGGDALIIG